MRKAYRTLIARVLMAIFLASVLSGCGSTATATDVPTPKVEAISDVENGADLAETDEELVEEVAESEPESESEPEPEPETLVEPVLDESKYFVDGIFYPKEYARQLGYTIYDSIDAVDCCSINHNGIEYFVGLTWGACSMSYSTGDRCFKVSIVERMAPDLTPECQIGTANVVESDSNYYLEAVMTMLEEVASGKNIDNPMLWDISGVTISTQWYDCSPEYFDNGFMKTTFKNPDKDSYLCRPYQ